MKRQTQPKETLGPAACIKRYLERDGGERVTAAELKALLPGEREELAREAAEALGVKLEVRR
jgi:hypothetical protein